MVCDKNIQIKNSRTGETWNMIIELIAYFSHQSRSLKIVLSERIKTKTAVSSSKRPFSLARK